MFEGKVAVVTGGADGIGKCIAGEFQKCGAQVAGIDKAPGAHFVGDLAGKGILKDFSCYVSYFWNRRECRAIIGF